MRASVKQIASPFWWGFYFVTDALTFIHFLTFYAHFLTHFLFLQSFTNAKA